MTLQMWNEIGSGNGLEVMGTHVSLFLSLLLAPRLLSIDHQLLFMTGYSV